MEQDVDPMPRAQSPVSEAFDLAFWFAEDGDSVLGARKVPWAIASSSYSIVAAC